jgi:tRNA(Glu) U13 pseudouridine synthase TruD
VIDLRDLDTILCAFFKKKLKKRRGGHKGFDLSVLRSFLFNQVLKDFLQRQQLKGTSFCQNIDGSEQLPLYGESREQPLLKSEFGPLLSCFLQSTQLIEAQRVAVSWRGAREWPSEWSHVWLDDNTLQTSFTLNKGSYATVLLAHLFTMKEPNAINRIET